MAHYNGEPSSLEKVKRHPKYYLSGGDLHFLVENYIFRVHRYFFERESAYFREKFAVAAPPGQQPKGSSDATALPIEDVLANDFARFLWVFYNPKYSIYDATVNDWSAILKLAFDWRFAEVKKLCVRELEKFEIPPLQKIELYQTYELDKKLLIPSYIAMCMRPEPLSIKEGRQLGLETALLLATARETARGKPSGSPGQLCSSPVTVENEDMISIIKDVFGIIVSPPSPSLSPLENTASASASMTPATNGTNGITTTTLKKLSLTTPSRTSATTAVDSTFGLSSASMLTAAGKDATKSPGQSPSTSSPTILNGRLNSVFAPMQGTVRPPPLEPPPRAPSPVVQTPTVETPSVEISAAPTPAVETPVLETPPVERVEEEQPAKQMTKKEKEKEKKKRQQEKKAAQRKGGKPPVASERTNPTEKDSEPSGNSTSTTDVISTQSQSDAPTLVDITTSTPTIAQPEQSEYPNEAATITDKPKDTSSVSTEEGQAPDPSHQATSSVDNSQHQQAESGRKVEGGAVELGTPTVLASETAQPVDTSSTAVVDLAAGTTAEPSTEAQVEAGAEASESAAVNETVSTEAPVEDTALSQPELIDNTSADASVTTPAGGSDPASEGGEKTESSVKEDKTASEGSNVADVNVNDTKADPADVPAPPAAATDAPAEDTSQTQLANGEAPIGEAASAVADAKTTATETEAPAASSSSTDKPASPSATGDEKPADAATSKPNAWGKNKTPTTPSQPPKPNAWGTNKTPTTPNQPTAPKPGASGQSSSKTPTTPTQLGAAPTGSAAESPRTTAPKPNAWGFNNKGSAATPSQSTTSPAASENKNTPPAGSEKAAGAATERTRTPTPRPTINTNVPNACNKPSITTPGRFATILAKVQGKAPSSVSSTTAPAQSEDKNADHGAKDASPIPGAWQESNGSAPSESAGGSAKPDQPPELAAPAQNAKEMPTNGSHLVDWDFGEEKLE